jgi:hypothetical protein
MESVEIYKIYVEMTDRLSQRRQAVNGIYFTILSGLGISIGLIYEKKPFEGNMLYYSIILLSFVGVLLCIAWWKIIENYHKIGSVKYEVIREIEEEFIIKPYTVETKKFRKANNQDGITKLAQLEKWVTLLLIIPFGFFIVYSIYKIF